VPSGNGKNKVIKDKENYIFDGCHMEVRDHGCGTDQMIKID